MSNGGLQIKLDTPENLVDEELDVLVAQRLQGFDD